MQLQSISQFRTYIKINNGNDDDLTDENFVGTYYKEKDELIKKGFFNIYHGKKENIAAYLRSTAVNIAADEQAIYEFMQNAVDCGATHFYIFYNEEYFIAINNGNQFQPNEITAILNLGQSQKGNAEIGSYGIGFKIVHRLVGKNDGVTELTQKYKGPTIFSWSRLDDLKALLRNDELEFTQDYNDNKAAPWLFKICLTTFPVEPHEKVKDINYIERILFPKKELKELVEFVNSSIKPKILRTKNLKRGTLFFLKLGEGKKQYLDNNFRELKRGVGYSLNTLKNLRYVCINDSEIKKYPLKLIKGLSIKKGTDVFNEIEPENCERDIEIIFGFDENYNHSKKIANAPNFYNFFPMESEVNEFRFIIHCNAFDNRANRRELHKSIINEKLLKNIILLILKRLDSYKQKNRNRFLQIYASLLLSEIPKDNREWLLHPFFDHILLYLKNNIPTTNSYRHCDENVVFKEVELNISISDFGIENYYWFFFEDPEIWPHAKNKLSIKSWTIIDLIYQGKTSVINKWIRSNKEIIPNFFEEFRIKWKRIGDNEREKFTENLRDLELFEFEGDENLLSLNQIKENKSYLLWIDKITIIKETLIKIGFKISKINISKFSKISNNNQFETALRSPTILKNFNDFYKVLNEKLLSKAYTLSIKEKELLLITLYHDFKINSNDQVKKINLFKDNEGTIKKIEELIIDDEIINNNIWLKKYKIEKVENENVFDIVCPLACTRKHIYQKIIYPNWADIVKQNNTFNDNNINLFYEHIIEFYQQDDSKNLSSKDYIWTGREFLSKDRIFYHEKLLDLSDTKYKIFRTFIQKSINKQLPKKQILEFLGKEPFKTEFPNILKSQINSMQTFTEEELSIFLSWSKEVGTQFFRYYIVKAEKNDFKILLKKTNSLQFYTDQHETLTYVNKFTNLYPLPNCFSEYSTDDVLVDSSLYRYLLDKIDIENLDSDAIKIFKLSSESNKKLFIEKIDTLSIETLNLPNNKDLIYYLLDFACSIEDEDNIVNFRDIIEIDDYKLGKNVVTQNIIKVQKYELNISRLLGTELDEKIKLIEIVISHFNKMGLHEELLKKIFGMTDKIEEDAVYDEFIQQLKKNEYICQNAEQLIYCIINKVEDAKELMKNEKSYNIFEYKHYCPDTPISYVEHDSVLSDIYNGLSSLLAIDDNNPYFTINEEAGFIYKPFFKENCFICPYLDFSHENDEHIDENRLYFLNDFYDEYLKICHNSFSIKTEDDIFKDLLEFSPNVTIFPNKYAVQQEKLPGWITEWICNDENKIKFISAIGVHTIDSPTDSIVKFRQDLSTQYNKLYKTPENQDLLKNTLYWLSNKNHMLISKKDTEGVKKIFEIIEPDIKQPFLTIFEFVSESPTYQLNLITKNDFFINDNQLFESEIQNNILRILNEKELKLVPLSKDYYPHVYINFIEDNLNIIEISDFLPDEEKILNGVIEEWKEEFYIHAKEELTHKIYLYDGPIALVQYFMDIPIKYGSDPDIGIGKNSIFINKKKYCTSIEILKLLSDQDCLEEILVNSKKQAALELGEKLINKGITENDIDFNKIEKGMREKDLINTFQSADKYSFKWFNSSLDILHANSESQPFNEMSIKFEKVIFDNKSEKLIHLEKPSSFVPYYVEYSEMITLYIYLENEQIKINLRGISIKTNQVDVLINEPLKILKKDIQYAKLKVSNTIDLIKEIRNAFIKLDYPENYCMQNNLPKDIEFIFGPPGTGKTTTLAKRIIELSKTIKKIIVLTPTNKAADVLTVKIMSYCNEKKIDCTGLIRFGKTLTESILDKGILKTGQDDLSDYRFMIIITTIARFSYDKYLIQINEEKCFFSLKNTKWDFVIFDEASMIALYYTVHALYQSYNQNENCKFIVSGDPFQIPPVIKDDSMESVKEENIYTLINLNSFNPEQQITKPHKYCITNLKTQYRSLFPIGQLFSQFCYDNYIKHKRCANPKREFNIIINQKKIMCLNTIRFKVNNVGIYKPGQIKKSGFQPYSAILVVEFIAKLARVLKGKWDIGIVCLYGSQAKLINNLILAYDMHKINPKIQILSDTVHGFQGDEYDIVFCVFNPSKNSIPSINHHLGRKSFLHKKNILNVAISRAKEYLFIFVPDDETININKFVYWNKMKEILLSKDLREYYQNFSDEEIEDYLFDNKIKYIEDNSFRTEHQLVNVYSKPFTKYFITSNENAIDIQINLDL